MTRFLLNDIALDCHSEGILLIKLHMITQVIKKVLQNDNVRGINPLKKEII